MELKKRKWHITLFSFIASFFFFYMNLVEPTLTSLLSFVSSREPVPGAGGHHPDQAERAHRGSAQSRRHRQHHHVGGHGLRNELFNRTVDTPQKIQTNHQYLLKGPRVLKITNTPKKHVHLKTCLHKHTCSLIHLGQMGGWTTVKERKILPFSAPQNAELYEVLFSLFSFSIYPFYCFCF